MSVLPVLPHLIRPSNIATRMLDTDDDTSRYTLTDYAWRWFDGSGTHIVEKVLSTIEKAILAKVGVTIDEESEVDIVEEFGAQLSAEELCDIWHDAIGTSATA